jgi:lycopene cyclase domain-containing protein
MCSFSPYLFLELALFTFLLGFGWEQWRLKELWSFRLLLIALSLSIFWFVIDQVALQIGLWTFPKTSTSSFRLVSLPIEEYLLFFLHTVVCFIFVKHFAETHRL